MILNLRCIYLGVGIGVSRSKLARLIPWKVAPGVLIVELKRSLAVRRSAVGVLLLPGKLMRVYLLFLWAYVATDVAICDAFVSWDLCFVDEKTCVGTFYVSDSLE